jgi:hypothetical protein
MARYQAGRKLERLELSSLLHARRPARASLDVAGQGAGRSVCSGHESARTDRLLRTVPSRSAPPVTGTMEKRWHPPLGRKTLGEHLEVPARPVWGAGAS